MLLVGSGNRHKLEELRSLLEGFSIEIVGLDRLPPGPDVEETGSTFEENAQIKALAYASRAASLPAETRPRWVVADDSGLVVDGLDGAPGVFSARFAGPSAGAKENNDKLLELLRDVPPERRSARFICVLACAEVPSEPTTEPLLLFTVAGSCEGRIAHEPRGHGGFGYDPLFVERSTGKTFAELDASEKNALSHRGHALRRFRKELARLAERSDESA